MSDLDARIRDWRQLQERETSLSARELDELEDHLRARVDLELETNAGLAPNRAFAIAREELGKSGALASEFAKARQPRWRKLMIAGWAMFGASLMMPALTFDFPGGAVRYGYEILWSRLNGPILVALPSLIVLLTIPTLWNPRYFRGRWLAGLLGGVLGAGGIVSLAFGFFLSFRPEVFFSFLIGSFGITSGVGTLGPGFWLWASSFLPVAIALQLRASHLKLVQPRAPFSDANQGALQ